MANRRNSYESKQDMVFNRKAKRRIKTSIMNKITTLAVLICSITIMTTLILNFLTRGSVEPNKAKLEGKYGHMEIAKSSEIPEHLKNAIISIEDKRFYSHKGVDIIGIGRAMVRNLVKDSSEGGSTIEMQISKNLLTSQEKTYRRKLQDIKIASRMNKCMTKDDILEVYLNSIYLAEGATGVKAGARIYFGKDVSELNLAEAAMLAGITKHPSKYVPYIKKEIKINDKKEQLENKLVFTTLEENSDSKTDIEIVEKLNNMGLLSEERYEQLKDGKIIVSRAELNPQSVSRQKLVLEIMKSNHRISKKEFEDAINTQIVLNTSLK